MVSADQRRHRILDLLSRDGYESIQALARFMRVSEMTIRRDLNVLESEGLIRRTHGGAITESIGQVDLDYVARRAQHAMAKRQIGEAAAAHVKDGDVVFLDAGTTVLAMTEHLLQRHNLTVVTHSLAVVDRLNGREGIELFLLGGQVRRDLMSVVGFQAEEFLASFALDKAFLGAGGIDPRRGLTHSTVEEIPIKKRAAQHARQVFVLADLSKFGKGGMMFFLNPSQIDCLITEGPRNAELIDLKGSNAAARERALRRLSKLAKQRAAGT
ncbi:MAG: DeoR/GlpR family DNA-binding transcription regulator [Pirellulaceae bacterium]